MYKQSIIYLLLIATAPFLMFCGERKNDNVDFNFFLNEKCMILNVEQDNSIEGEYLTVKEVVDDTAVIVNIPEDFYLSNKTCSRWILGWGSDTALFDAGCENLRGINSIDFKNKTIYLGELLRGRGLPEKGQRVVFWNTQPSGFLKSNNKPVLNTSDWKGFAGQSVNFGGIAYDTLLQKWIMIFHECDTASVSIFAAESENLTEWQPANQALPLMIYSDFEKISWANGKVGQTPFVSDIVRFNNKWYLFLDAYDKEGKRNIGLAISDDSLTGNYKIYESPLINAADKNSWCGTGVFYAKIVYANDKFVMFFDGRNINGTEGVGMAFSYDLLNWEEYEDNPVLLQHFGWRSNKGVSEPVYAEIHGDSIFLIVAGSKKFKMGAYHHYITGRMYRDVSGNVDDTQLGVFLSVNGGADFYPYPGNPVFINNYSDVYENEHLGGNLEFIKTDSAEYLFYQAKSDFEGLKYNIHLRVRKPE